MSSEITILDTMPAAEAFYRQYWNRRPFVIRRAIGESGVKRLISADELAALAMEREPRCRLIRNSGAYTEWTCRFGPFSEQDYDVIGDRNWSLMVQNVEQFHPDTASLLQYFHFAPRWMMDDVMVSFSAPGGTVGPHIDSYHVFLVQGQGKRRWKIGHAPISQDRFIEGMDLKVLETDFDGDEIDVNCGDVIYVPPRFGHEGVTLESSMTFSVGFLGPKMSDLLNAYGQYLSENADNDPRYVAQGINENSMGFIIGDDAITPLQSMLKDTLDTPHFNQWLVEYFTESSHEDFGEYSEREDVLSLKDFETQLEQGVSLVKPAYVKLAVTGIADGCFHLGVDSQGFRLDESLYSLVLSIMNEETIGKENSPSILGHTPTLSFLLELYNHQALEFVDNNKQPV